MSESKFIRARSNAKRLPEFAAIVTETGNRVNLHRKIYKDVAYFVSEDNEIYVPRDGEESIGKWNPTTNQPEDDLHGDIKAFMIDFETEFICYAIGF
jgi:hypothetical protein